MKDMRMRLIVIVIVVAALAGVVFAVGAAQQEGGATAEQDWQQSFQELDRDDKGYVTQAEVEHIPGLLEQWDELDVNQDERLDELEFSQFEPASTSAQTADTAEQEQQTDEQEQQTE